MIKRFALLADPLRRISTSATLKLSVFHFLRSPFNENFLEGYVQLMT